MQADVVEALVLRKILTTDRDEWLALYEEADRRYSAGETADSLKADKRRLAKAERTLRGLNRLAADAVDQPIQLADLQQQIKESVADIETLAERIAGTEERIANRDALRATIEELLTAEITPGGDDGEDNVPQRGSETWRSEALEACKHVLKNDDRLAPQFPQWLVKDAAETFARLGIVVEVKSTENPRRPEVQFDIEPARVSQEGTSFFM